MATWKDRGYVPDSDDEDDWHQPITRFGQDGKGDGDAHLPNENKFTVDKSTAESLEESLNHGLSLVRKALSINDEGISHQRTEIDSPLSSLSSSPSAPSTSPKRTPNQTLHEVLIPQFSSTQLRSRNLRQRTAIQHNPYSLEDAKYRQQFQERGLRPVRVHRHPSPEIGKDAEESQPSDLQVNSRVASQSVVSSEIEEDSLMLDSFQQLDFDLTPLYDDIDLPDLSTLIAKSNSPLPRRPVNKAPKRNAETSTQTPGLSSKLRLYNLYSSQDDNPKKGKRQRMQGDRSPTPPLSSTPPLPAPHTAEVSWNRAASPAALPTPLVSSETYSRKRIVISDDSSSESTSTQASTTSEEEQVLSEDDSQQVQAVARKTKGVLPASWLRLDKARRVTKVKQPARRQSFTAVAEKGVALRKVRTPRNAFDGHHNIIEALESSDSETELSAREFTATDTLANFSPGTRNVEIDEDGQDLDISEEDVIDRMLPSMERRWTKPRRKRQQQLHTYLSERVSAPQARENGSTPLRTRRKSRSTAGTKRPQKKRKVSATKHSTTVLHAPGLRSPTKEHQPRFLRIAARIARRSHQPKPVQPRRQMFSLATAEDNGDIDNAFDIVEHQASGSAVKQSQGRHQQTRPQTAESRAQTDTTEDQSGDAVAKLKASSRTILQRQNGNGTSTSIRDASAAVQSPSPPHGLHLTRLRILLPLRNRSGRGQLISRASTCRVAQVEAPYKQNFRPKLVQQRPRPELPNIVQQPSQQNNDVTNLEPKKSEKQPRKRKPTQRRLILNPASNEDQNSGKLIIELDNQEQSITHWSRLTDHEQSYTLTVLTKLRDASLDQLILEAFYRGLQGIRSLDSPTVAEGVQQPQDDGTSERAEPLPLTNLRGAECRSLDCWNSWSAKTFMDNYTIISQHLDEHGSPLPEESTTILSALNQMSDFAHANMVHASVSDATAFVEVSYSGLWKISQALRSQDLQSQSYSRLAMSSVHGILRLSEETCKIERLYLQSATLTTQGGSNVDKVETVCLHLASQALRRILRPTSLLIWFETCTSHEVNEATASADVLLSCETLLLAMRAYRCSERGVEQFWHDVASVVSTQNSSLSATLLYTLLAIAFIVSLSSYIDKYVPGNILERHEIPQTTLADLLSRNRDVASTQTQDAKSSSQRTRLLVYTIMCDMWHNYGWKPLQKILLIWFQDFQKFWFSDHTASKCSHLHSNEQQSFRLFLRALALHVDKTYEEDSESSIQKLRSLLFSLTPNTGRIGEQGQIGEKTRTLDVRDVQLVRNVFDLHVEMIRLAPRFAPRIRTLEAKVDFSTAHLAICRVALSAWESLASKQEHEVASDLASWYHTMTVQSVQRWHLAESEIRKELEETPHRFSAKTIKDIINANQEEAGELLGYVTEAFTPQIQTYVQGDHTRSGFICELAHSVLQIPSSESLLSEHLVLKAISAVKTAVSELGKSISSPLVPALVKSIKQSIVTQLGGKTMPSSKLMRLCIDTYVDVAKIAVGLRHNHWDEFLLPSSSYALGMLVDRARLLDLTTMFFARFVDVEPSIFVLECRVRVFEHWLQELLRPGAGHGFISLLTRSLFQHETESLMLTELSDEFKDSDGGFSEATMEQNFSHIRRSAVKHIIRQIHAQEGEPEADWLVGGLEETDALRLLSTIFSTLKSTWLSLGTQQDKQVEYEHLIDDILAEYEVFPRQDFKLDPWFYSALGTTARRKYSLNRAFELRSGRRDLSYSAQDIARTFASELEQAISLDQTEQLSRRLRTIFLPTDLALVTEDNKAGRYAVDLKAQAEFISTEVPKHILPSAAPTDRDRAKTALLCNLLCYIIENLELRVDSLILDTVTPLLEAVQRVINCICLAGDESIVQPASLFKLTRLTFDWTARLDVENVSEQFWGDVETVCALAATDEGTEAIQLLESVMESS